jgi:hypothetical protein
MRTNSGACRWAVAALLGAIVALVGPAPMWGGGSVAASSDPPPQGSQDPCPTCLPLPTDVALTATG